MESYRVPAGLGQSEYIEKKSRFLGCVFPVETEEEAVNQIKKMRETYWDATHNVYAYILHGGTMRYSDDSEPQGTAGMPVLEVLRREGLENVLCVVTRYFGGILLGAGGLVRAYTKAAKLGVDAAGISQKRVWQKVEVPCTYALYERLKKEVPACGGIVTDTQFGADVTVYAMFPAAETDQFLLRVTDLSGGKTAASVTGMEYKAFPVEK